jgi:hypothetical protein
VMAPFCCGPRSLPKSAAVALVRDWSGVAVTILPRAESTEPEGEGLTSERWLRTMRRPRVCPGKGHSLVP